MDQQDFTADDAARLVSAVVGESSTATFATELPRSGDVALILRENGGIEVLSVMPDNPSKDTLQSLGIRGLFALALLQLARNPDLMLPAMEAANAEVRDTAASILPN